MQRRLAPVTLQFDPGLGPVDQLSGLGGIERSASQGDVLHQFDIDAAGPEQHHRSHFGIQRAANDELELGLDLLRNQDALELRIALQLLDQSRDVIEGFLHVGGAVQVQHHAANVGFM